MKTTLDRKYLLACAGFSNSLIWVTMSLVTLEELPRETGNMIRLGSYLLFNYLAVYLTTRKMQNNINLNSMLCGFASFFLYSLLGIFFTNLGRAVLTTLAFFLIGSFLGGITNSLMRRIQ